MYSFGVKHLVIVLFTILIFNFISFGQNVRFPQTICLGVARTVFVIVLNSVVVVVVWYVMMTNVDKDVMNMFTQSYGLNAEQLTKVCY